MNKLIISGEVCWDTKQTDRDAAINELFDNLVKNIPGIEISITNDAWLVDENGNEAYEDDDYE